MLVAISLPSEVTVAIFLACFRGVKTINLPLVFHITTSDDYPLNTLFPGAPDRISFSVRKGLSWFINFNAGR